MVVDIPGLEIFRKYLNLGFHTLTVTPGWVRVTAAERKVLESQGWVEDHGGRWWLPIPAKPALTTDDFMTRDFEEEVI